MSSEQFSLIWNSFPTNLSSGLYSLLTDEHLVDVTLTAEGQILRAHKLILSVCSSYFRELFKGNMCKHPIVILKDVNYRDLLAMLHFMYQGEVNIKQEDISSFLKLGETLEIKGLTKEKQLENLQNRENKDITEHIFKTEQLDDTYDIPEELSTVESLHTSDPVAKSPQPSVSPSLSPEKSFVKLTSDNSFHNSEVVDSKRETVMRSIHNIFNESHENPIDLPPTNDEPLDCTSEVRETTNINEEQSSYRFNVNLSNSSQDTVPNLQPLSQHSQEYKKETLGVNNEPTNSKDLNNDRTNFTRGKRTVKGIPGSSLPLETTLRVVSEIGPTLRFERGKVVRMYSCPWCLRQFTRKENLKLHVRYIHGPLESLTCKLCGNKYKNSNSLRVHSYLYHNTKRNKHTKPTLVGGTI